MTNAPLNAAEYEYAMPERIDDLPEKAPQQVAKRFMVLLLRGACTEFTDSTERAKRIIDDCVKRGHSCLLFRYSEELECYELYTGEL